MEDYLNQPSPNHALQRTAPRVTVAADSDLGVFTPSHLSFYLVCLSFAPPRSYRATLRRR